MGASEAKVFKLVPVNERLKRDRARSMLDFLRGAEGLDLQPWEVERVRNALFRVAEPASEAGLWPGGYDMISRELTAKVWDWIRELPAKDRPSEVRHAFDIVLVNLRPDTGEVMLTRDQIADRMRVAPREVTRAFGVLSAAGVILRERRKVAGMRGPGVAVYRINPHLAWNGSLQARADAVKEAEPPLLVLMQGGRVSEDAR